MAYEFEVYPDAEEQIDALPPEVRAALGRAMTVLALVPWNGLAYNDDMPDGSMPAATRPARSCATWPPRPACRGS